MPIRPAEFDEVAHALEPVLDGLPPKLIAIDGRCFVGKTTLGRFLSWYFNSSLLELDLFLSEGGLVHRYEEVGRIVRRRLEAERPIFVEGATVLRVLQRVQVEADYLVYVHNPYQPRGLGFGKELDEYEREFQPRSRANYLVASAHEG